MSVPFPAFCPNCGLIFQSQAFQMDEGMTAEGLTLHGSRERCPRCHAWAELPDGTFNITADTVEVLSASGLTRERLLRLAEVLDQARRGEMSADAATEAVTDEAPSLRPLLERYGATMRMALLALLWAVIQILLAQGMAELRDNAATKEDVQQAVEQAIERCQQR